MRQFSKFLVETFDPETVRFETREVSIQDAWNLAESLMLEESTPGYVHAHNVALDAIYTAMNKKSRDEEEKQ
jgi:hypothetical protein